MNDIPWKKKKARRQEIKEHVRKFLLYPSFWKDPNKRILDNLKWKYLKFEEHNYIQVPSKKGIYCFVVIPPLENKLFITRYLFYIGKASGTTLRTRYKNYIDEMNDIAIGKNKPRVKVQEMLNDYFEFIYFFFVEESDAKKVIDYEDKLINIFMPYVNTSIPEAKISEEYRHIY